MCDNCLVSTSPFPEERKRALTDVFSKEGALARQIEGFTERAGQRDMADAIASAIADSTALIAEAGTGTGKTFAYLVPALLWGGKVIVSTGTKTLQDQLFHKDLPTVRAALGAPVTTALLKGRANYLCHYHLARTESGGRLGSRQDVGYLRRIVRFMQTTKTGDRAELPDVPEDASIWTQVTSTRDNCLSVECPHYRECFVMQARREAQQAEVVVVNHHLFFADLMLREEGVTDLLPTANTVIFDEAHQLPETATLFFGQTVSTAQLFELSRDTLAEGLAAARDALVWPDVAARLERAARELRLALPPESTRLHIRQLPPQSRLRETVAATRAALDAFNQVLEGQAARSEGLERCWQRGLELARRLGAWGEDDDPESIHWVEAYSQSLQLHTTPLSVAAPFTRQRQSQPRAWIFVSATLSVHGDFSHFSHQLGLEDARTQSWPSPFQYERQALLYVPRDLPEPLAPGYTEAVVEAALPVVRAAGGRTFILCTTLKAVRIAAERVRLRLGQLGLDFPVLMQGEGGRSELLERFRRAGNAVLVGSQSFWEGIDVRGSALSVVVIDKLPFAPPDDPVLAARLDALARAGGQPFMDYQLPEAVLTLKQGAGRLIRDETDRGVLMLCDPRLISKPYGRRIWQSLPPFRRTREEDEAVAFFDGPTRTSTSVSPAD